MPANTVKVPSSSGGVFDCYLALPAAAAPTAAIVLANAILGVNKGAARGIADEFAAPRVHCGGARPVLAHGAGAAPHDDPRTARARQPRLEKIKTGEADMADTLKYCARCRSTTAALRSWVSATAAPTPFSVRSGSATTPASPATAPNSSTLSRSSTGLPPRSASSGAISIAAPPTCSDAYRAAPARRRTSTCTSSPACHGYMLPHSRHAFDAAKREFSMGQTRAILAGLRGSRVEAAE